MLYLLVLLSTLIVNFRSPIVQSTCIKTQQQPNQIQQHVVPFTSRTSNPNHLNNRTDCDEVNYQREGDEHKLNTLSHKDSKYKIPSNFALKTDPNLLAPSVTATNNTGLLTETLTDKTTNSTNTKTRRQQAAEDEYLVGVGIADITGPAADINLMGYAKPSQDAGGIHLRQFSRSIMIEDKTGNRILYISIDNGMISQLLRSRLLRRLADTYGSHVFNESNVMMTASHSHSCPGGFFQYMLYNIPSAGFIQQTLDALLSGIERSVRRATNSAFMRPARLYYNEGELLETSINRSPTSYMNNPAEEREKYRYDTDKTMQLIKILDKETRKPLAMLSWFPVHGTSMNNTNHLISGDNKGYASLLFEQEMAGGPENYLIPGRLENPFVAIFAQANEGDVSPNTRGARCIDTGLPCDLATSTCNGQNEKCIAFGPGKDQFESTWIIAQRQYLKARQLFHEAKEIVRGPVRFVHEYVDMTKQVVPLYEAVYDLAKRQHPKPVLSLNSTYRTCPAALGYSFAAGTTDGPGALDFQQGDTASSRYWNMVRDFLRRPSNEQIRCHHPKPILLSTGEMDFPYMWHPKIVPTQIIMLGQLAIVGLPGEFTTMAGRRVRNAVYQVLNQSPSKVYDPDPKDDDEDDDDDDYDDDELINTENDEMDLVVKNGVSVKQKRRRRQKKQPMTLNGQLRQELTTRATRKSYRRRKEQQKVRVILSGLTNIYTSYITTLEEFEIQRYEGASTLYGPHTLQAYVNQFRWLADLLHSNQPSRPNQPQPPDLSKSLFTLKPGVLFDSSPHGKTFGDLLVDVDTKRSYRCQEKVSVSFIAGNPRNNLRQEDSFLYVDRYTGNGTWQSIASDTTWDTKFIWERTNVMFGESKATVHWNIPIDCRSAFYRIVHSGSHKNIFQTVSQYSGVSSIFKVIGQNNELPFEDSQLELSNQPVGSLRLVASSGIARKRESESPYKRGYYFLSNVIKRFL